MVDKALSLRPPRNSRFMAFGPTRSGKTVLMETALAGHDQVLVVDPKGQWEARPQDLEARSLEELREQLDVMSDLDGVHLVYRVPREHLRPENSRHLDEVARLALERTHTLLYYDELVFVASGNDFARRAPNYYYAITTGASRGVGVWGCAQRPVWIPAIARSETDLRATFFLRTKADRDSVEEIMGEGVDWEALRQHRYSWVLADDHQTTRPHTLIYPEGRTQWRVGPVHRRPRAG